MKEQGPRDQGNEGPSAASPLAPALLAGPAIILLAAFVAIVPQLIRGNSCGHDFDVHLVSWLDCVNAWRHGIPYPHWAPSPNYGAGEPRFVFYPPLTWMLGAALGAILPWNLAPIALTFSSSPQPASPRAPSLLKPSTNSPATLAGCVSLFSGFTLFTAYERSAFPEFAGGFWLPLIILFVLRSHWSPTRLANPIQPRIIPPRLRRLNRPARHRTRRRMAFKSSRSASSPAICWPASRFSGLWSTNPGLHSFAPQSPPCWASASPPSTGFPQHSSAIGSTSVRPPQDPGYNFENNWLFSRTVPIRSSRCTT